MTPEEEEHYNDWYHDNLDWLKEQWIKEYIEEHPDEWGSFAKDIYDQRET